jgi:small subunit ribosomal protein S8|tara:strand:+ start:107 stop:505 length:399 start_codon:yes stop_codon:yes gene_type:complete
MSFTDPIGDMITRIRNGQMRSHVKIEMPASTFKGKILEILKREGFILNYSLDQVDEKKTKFTIDLKYNSGSPVINNIERISKPGRRFYSSAQSIPRIRNGLGIAIVSTSRGVMTDSEARKAKIGGEIICRIF